MNSMKPIYIFVVTKGLRSDALATNNFTRQNSPFRGIKGVLKTTSPERDRVFLLKREEEQRIKAFRAAVINNQYHKCMQLHAVGFSFR